MSTVDRSVRNYRRLLRLYPKQFRDEYGEDMVFVFEEMLRDLPTWRVWLRTLRDATSSTVTQRLETTMSKPSMLRPVGFAALATAVLVTVSAFGVENLVVFLATLAVASASVIAAFVYWLANRAYVEPSQQLHRYWLRCVGGGALMIGAVNVGSGLDLTVPWLLLFSTVIFGAMLVFIGVMLGVWHGVDRLRSARPA